MPVRIRPRIETSPVNGHFLSRQPKLTAYTSQLPVPTRASYQHTDICSLNSSLWCSEPQPNVLVPSSSTFTDLGAFRPLGLLVDEDVRLFLIGALRLHRQLCRHDCGVAFREGVFEAVCGMCAIAGGAKSSLAEKRKPALIRKLVLPLFTSRISRQYPLQ